MHRHYAVLLRRAAALPSLPLVASLHAAALRRSAVLAPSLIHQRTLSARTALASAMSAHGRCREVLGLFVGPEEGEEMDDKAVTAVLAACARAGMVDEGRRVFATVRRPALQHYTCMVELLGRAGEVDEAEVLVARMEARPDRVICAALLAACRVHGRVDVAERVHGLMRHHGIA
uniref:Pentacotripeptide-repeat region of PRORP domain-containing protein n=1 Tax=Oryza brachyantha TaxID=4533 RepID=J3N678_ORYBR